MSNQKAAALNTYLKYFSCIYLSVFLSLLAAFSALNFLFHIDLRSSGSAIHLIALLGAATFTLKRFVKTEQRIFSDTEKNKFIRQSTLIVTLIQFIVGIPLILFTPLPFIAGIIGLAIGLIIVFLVSYLLLKITFREKTLERYLKKYAYPLNSSL